ncbi:MAG: Maf family protein [Bacteroidota bacterium]
MLSLDVPLILASASPRRKRLLSTLGLSPDVRPANADETWPDGLPLGRAVETIALRKARAIEEPAALVVAADTVVVLDGDVLGKPADAEEARATLARLSGRTHTVATGIALRMDGREQTTHALTLVTFADLQKEEIEAYVRTGSPLDKAGSYGIQDDLGALLVDRIEGDYFNVVGLPLRLFYETVQSFLADIPST